VLSPYWVQDAEAAPQLPSRFESLVADLVPILVDEPSARQAVMELRELCAIAVKTAHTDASPEPSVAAERTGLIEAYKRECTEQGIRVTNTKIAKAARRSWNERTPVQRWLRNDSRCGKGDDAAIRRVLKEKSHLK
jgi:hypothetical protein